jgi:hypothetical protein
MASSEEYVAMMVAPGCLRDKLFEHARGFAKDRPNGITRTEVRDLFSRNKKAREIDRALSALDGAGRPQRQPHADDRGRPAEVWIPNVA